jgi:hypothetical protein
MQLCGNRSGNEAGAGYCIDSLAKQRCAIQAAVRCIKDISIKQTRK